MTSNKWVDIPGYERTYQVNLSGMVKALARKVRKHDRMINWPEKILRNNKNQHYYYVTLCKDGKCKNYQIHRLLAELFIPNPDNKKEVNHKDGDKLNNALPNLEWCTRGENMQHAWDNNLRKKRSVSQYSLDMQLIKIWDRVTDTRFLGFSPGNIVSVARGQRFSAYGFIWKY